MSSLSPQSQALANQLASAGSTTPKPVQSTPVAPTPKPEVAAVKPTVVTEDVALDQEHKRQATNGSLIKAKFISIEGEDINLLMNQGRSEVTVPLSRLTKDSLALANKLNKDLIERNKMRQEEAKDKRQKMKVPDLAESDLNRYHKWMSSTGSEIEAIYVDAGEEGVTCLRNNPNRPYELGWERLNPQVAGFG